MPNPKIKKGFNFYLYYWTIPAFFFFFFVNYYTKNIKIEALDIGLMISVVSFLFGFLVSITFSLLLTKVGSLKNALAEETGRITSVYLLSKHLGQEFQKKMRARLDNYTIITLRDYENYHFGRDEFYGIYHDLESMDLKTESKKTLASSMLYILGEWEVLRERLESLTGKKTEWSLKAANFVLGLILIVLLYLNRADTFTNSLFIILSTIIVFIFLIIEDYDNLRIGDYTANISNSEQIFDLIVRPRYYPENILNRIELEEGKTYRIGFYNKKTKEEIITPIKYSSKK